MLSKPECRPHQNLTDRFADFIVNVRVISALLWFATQVSINGIHSVSMQAQVPVEQLNNRSLWAKSVTCLDELGLTSNRLRKLAVLQQTVVFHGFSAYWSAKFRPCVAVLDIDLFQLIQRRIIIIFPRFGIKQVLMQVSPEL
jgi:hypothetical protein